MLLLRYLRGCFFRLGRSLVVMAAAAATTATAATFISAVTFRLATVRFTVGFSVGVIGVVGVVVVVGAQPERDHIGVEEAAAVADIDRRVHLVPR